MADNRPPFKSSVTDFEELRKRLYELGIGPVIGSAHGVDVSEKPAPKQEPKHYYGY